MVAEKRSVCLELGRASAMHRSSLCRGQVRMGAQSAVRGVVWRRYHTHAAGQSLNVAA